MRKKIVSPAHRRAAAEQLVAAGMCSGRAVCRYLGLARSTFRYQGRPATAAEAQLRKELLELSAKHPRYGYRRMAALLRRQGWRVGKRHIQRLRRDEGLRVPPTRRKLVRRGVSTGLPTTATHKTNGDNDEIEDVPRVAKEAPRLPAMSADFEDDLHHKNAEDQAIQQAKQRTVALV